ncbi:MAG TPA: hypothetical protein VJ970_00990 [Flavobacteriaceae bacterium]|nr:hypothetical protein [Flavobacteriaceae bacterium]
MEEKIHIYCVPGLGASSKIFEYLNFPSNTYQLHYIDWLIPLNKKESLTNYAKRMAALVKHKNAVLIGVSFGGVLVQEMQQFLQPKKIIIISSVKTEKELPPRLTFLRNSKIYKILPLKLAVNYNKIPVIQFSNYIKKRIKLYNKYFSVKNVKYLKWAIYHTLHWKKTVNTTNITHIHGDQDEIFPIEFIGDCITIKNATHIMIITHAKKITSIIQNVLNKQLTV